MFHTACHRSNTHRMKILHASLLALVLCAGCGSDADQSANASRLPTEFTHRLHPDSHEYVYDIADIEGGTTELTLRVFKPEFATADVPLPVVLLINTSSFLISNSDDDELNRGVVDDFIASGALCILVETRIQQDNPREPDGPANGAVTPAAESINAIIWDAYRSVRWVQDNPANFEDGWAIEPDWVFLGGGSAGGITAMCAVIRHWEELRLRGLITVVAAFGLDNALFGINYTDALRDELGHTGAQYTAGMPPVCAFVTGEDMTINEPPNDWSERYRDRVESLGWPSIVHWYKGGGHILLDMWDEPGGLTDANTVKEAIFNFLTDAIVEEMDLKHFENVQDGAERAHSPQ